MPCVRDVVCQRTQSTPQHNDRLYPWETLCLTHLFASAFNQILSFSVGLNISDSPTFLLENDISSSNSKRRWFFSV